MIPVSSLIPLVLLTVQTLLTFTFPLDKELYKLPSPFQAAPVPKFIMGSPGSTCSKCCLIELISCSYCKINLNWHDGYKLWKETIQKITLKGPQNLRKRISLETLNLSWDAALNRAVVTAVTCIYPHRMPSTGISRAAVVWWVLWWLLCMWSYFSSL